MNQMLLVLQLEPIQSAGFEPPVQADSDTGPLIRLLLLDQVMKGLGENCAEFTSAQL